MKRTTKKKAPSRVRYEQSHPTVSCRVPSEVYEMLQAIKAEEGKGFSDILKIGLGILESKAEKEDEAYSQGYNDGSWEAELEFKVTYHCLVCGKTIKVNASDEKEAIEKYMQEHGWGHVECHEKRRKGYL